MARRSMGRSAPEEITLFKSVGAAIEDLAAAIAVYGKSE
jgi:ornithine cyclodeaminase